MLNEFFIIVLVFFVLLWCGYWSYRVVKTVQETQLIRLRRLYKPIDYRQYFDESKNNPYFRFARHLILSRFRDRFECHKYSPKVLGERLEVCGLFGVDIQNDFIAEFSLKSEVDLDVVSVGDLVSWFQASLETRDSRLLFL